ncbi:MAG: sugar phosphate isomerase/epimerase [Planctomycetes bacterium]|nr:sugar phosphate isomerase/epimerase [Planctomycetota bacterium]
MTADRIGALVELHDPLPDFQGLLDLGLRVCQLQSWKPEMWNDALGDRTREDARRRGIHMTSFWAGYAGPCRWNFTEGPTTIGLVPPEHRAMRVESLKRAGGFARALGVPAVITHLGFIPENAGDPLFADVVAAVRDIALHYQELGIAFWFETGQETPTTLLRLINAVALPNLGVNLDPANLIMYGRGNPIDALLVLGPWVRNVHAKDGRYPSDPLFLGPEVKVGEGLVRFSEFVASLEASGFTGEYVIEREISGAQQRTDILETAAYLRTLLN